ncbi:MAG: plasmid pRiA4b ORF-3 family protein [Thermincolia bacterium]
MLIQCTKKLLDELKIKPSIAKNEEPLFSWHANLLTLNRRKTIVLVNDSNRYVIVLHGLKAKDFKALDQIIIKGIQETLLGEHIKAEIVEQFTNHSPEIVYAKTKDRSMVARMNKACDTVYFYANSLKGDVINQSFVSIRASSSLVGDGNNSYITPYEAMYSDLEAFAKEPIFRCKAVELLVTLDLENYDIWRKIIVPLNITFEKLHDILQIVFQWRDCHLHDFYIFDGDKPIINLVSTDDAFEYENNVPMISETGIKLSDYVPKFSRIKYNYDFGDNWQHSITVEKIIEDYAYNYPTCLEGVGNAPPEDVGGEYGYAEYLEAVSDPQHPEHKNMLAWVKMQWYHDFDIKQVNGRLRRSLKW